MSKQMIFIEESKLVNLIKNTINRCISEKLSSLSHTHNDIQQYNQQLNPIYKNDIFTFDEVCDILRIKETTLFNLIKNNKITSYKNGGKRQFLKEDVIGYIDNVKNTSKYGV